jgi:hypothetical protein
VSARAQDLGFLIGDTRWTRVPSGPAVQLQLAPGHSDERNGEVTPLLHARGTPYWRGSGYANCIVLLVKDDPHYDELVYRPSRC